MLQHRKIWIFLLTLLLLVTLVIVVSKKDRAFNKVELSYDNHVTNYTRMPFLDTVIYVGMEKLELCDVTVQVRPLSKQAKENFGSNIELQAMIYGNGNHYDLWIDNMSRQEAIGTVAHELVHLIQYRSKELVHEGIYVYWNRSKYDYKEMSYETRPWEADAFEKQVPLEAKIRSALY